MYSSTREAIVKAWLPEALAIGVNYHDFWFMTPKTLEVFIRAFELKTEREMKIINYHGWLNGVYIMNALGSLLSQNSNYPECPYEIQQGVTSDARGEIEAELFRAYAEEYNKHLQHLKPSG